MTSNKVRLVVIAAACLALAAMVAPAGNGSPATTKTYSTNSTEDGHQGADVLIANSGYMVAVG